MDVLPLLNRSDANLKEWALEQDETALNETFASIWNEIRGARLAAGQPRSVQTANCVELARVSETIAKHRNDERLLTEAWRMLAYSLNANEQYEEAVAFYELAVPRLDQSDPALATRTRNGYVFALSHTGKYEKALRVAADAERWLKEHHDEVGFARLCTNVADLYARQDEHGEAYRYHQMALEVFERIGDQQAIAQLALNLGMDLTFLDRFEESDEWLEKSETLSETLGLPDLSAQAAYNRAYLYYLRGRYSEALRGFSRLRSFFERSGSKRHYALCDLDEAEIYVQLNLAKDAATLARRAMEQFKAMGFQYEHVKAQAFLGTALIQLGRSDEALEAFQAAQQGFEAEGNQYRVGLLDLYRAEVLISLKRLWEARRFAASAKDRFIKIGIPSKSILSLVVLGRISLELKDMKSAEACVSEIVELTRNTTLPLLRFPYFVLSGDIAERKEQWKEAEACYESAAEDLEVHQARLHHDDLRVTFFNGRNRAYEELVWLKLKAGDDIDTISAAYAWSERAKSRGLIELLSQHLSAVQPQTEHPLLSKIGRLREELNVLYARSRPELQGTPFQNTETTTDSNLDAIAHKENELARTLREVSRTDPEYASLQQVTTATLDSVQKMLPEDTTLIEYFIARDEVLAFVLSRETAHIERHLCPVSRVQDLQQRLGFQLEKFLLGREFLDLHSEQIAIATQRHLGELYKLLMARVVERVRTAKLTIIPHGILHLLPFHAFFDGEKHLIDSFEISYAPSASVLKYCLEKKDVDTGVPSLIGVADEQAPFVEDEILRIRSMFPHASTLLNHEATRDAFVAAATQASFVHIATHAIFRQDNPMFSGFKLADGWMTAFDVFSMNCQTNLVTLSGCKSGMSQVTGSDDLVGLMRGFLYAGARSLMVSLWNVDDQATAVLMTKFYNSWKTGKTRTGALSAAMKDVRKTHPNPFYWAPFLLIGKG